MSALTSFDALHEPPAQPEEQPENVLSKIFQKVKSSLTTSSYTPSLPLSQPTAPNIVSGTGTNSSSFSLGTAASSSNGSDSTLLASALVTTDHLQVASSSSTSHEKIASSSSSIGSSSDTGSWITQPESQAGSSSHGGGAQKSGTLNGLPIPRITDDKDRTIVARRYGNSSNAPKRASSLFKVSTVDHSIVQDDDTASLSSLAPPVVSLSPAFGDQQVPRDEFLESSGAMMIRSADSRAVDYSRLSAGILWHFVFESCPYRTEPQLKCLFLHRHIGDGSATRDYLHHTLGARDASYDSDARSIRSFSSGHQKGNSLTKVIRRLRGEGVNRDYWMADENAKDCFGCNASFFVFRRKHHCRICGRCLG
jgi:hypothetical protein